VTYINTQPCPQLPVEFSDDFRDFLAKTLVKNPVERLAARELLKHPFIRQHTDPFQFKAWINTIPDIIV
jgi:serine/threonine protein kinase